MQTRHRAALHALLFSQGLLALLWIAAPARAALTWNWSFQSVVAFGQPVISGSGTFTTDGTQYLANTTYTVTGITGTFVDVNEVLAPQIQSRVWTILAPIPLDGMGLRTASFYSQTWGSTSNSQG